MSKHFPSISGLACVIWVAGWTWGLSTEHSDQFSNQIAAPSIYITDADSVFTAKEVFSFHLNDEKPVIPAESYSMLKKMAQYLAGKPAKILTLTGSYLPLPLERNQSQHPNLGIARANSIRDVLVGEGADPDQIKTASQEVQNNLLVEGRMLSGVDFDFNEIAEITETTPIEKDTIAVVKKDKEVDSESHQHGKTALVLNYDFQDFTLATKYRSDLDDLRRLVRDNPSYRLIITGYSSKDEEKEVAGLAERRSLAVRRYLVDTGVRRRNIIVESQPSTANNESERRVEISIVK